MVKIMPINRIATRADLGELINGFDYQRISETAGEKSNATRRKVITRLYGT